MNITELRVDRSCQRRTNWRFDIDPGSVGALSRALQEIGYTQQTIADRLLIFQAPRPSVQVLCVLSTGRVQLRVHPTVAEGERRHTAERLYVNLCRALFDGGG